ncbi:NAD(P)H-dependent amine dehydrogenase family protein [Clostridioides difficile]
MNRKVRIAQLGCGKMGSFIMRYAIENGADLVAAFDMNPAIIGKDLSVVLGGEDIGTTISSVDSLDEKLKEIKPDCVVIATRSLIKDVKKEILVCAKNGINVVTTCDEALFPWNSSPVATAEIDRVAKENNCTITGAGFPDLSYCHLVAATAGSAHSITKIQGSAQYNVEDYGIALAEHHGAGFSAEEFEEKIASVDKISDEARAELIQKGEFMPIPMWNANGWLCSKLGLTVKRQVQVCTPLFYDGDLESKTLKRVVKKGEVIGMSAKAITETEEGIKIETESIGKIYAQGEVDTNDWTIYGEPDIYVSNKHIKNTEMICSLMVSRIIDAINAPAGFVTSDNFNPAKFVLKSINEYID